MTGAIPDMVKTDRQQTSAFASLHPGLIARKGQAAPAPANLSVVSRESAPQAKPADHPAEKPRVTLRLTERQRRLLRLVSAATDRSNQDILSAALDKHLTRIIGEELGDCRCLRKYVLDRAQKIDTAEEKA